MRTTLTALLAALLATGFCGCKAPADPAVQAKAKDSSTPHGEAAETKADATGGNVSPASIPGNEKGREITFLEYVIIESQIRCLVKGEDTPAEKVQAATLKVLSHHGVNEAWLESTRKLANEDGQKSGKSKALFDEARTMICPEGKPNEELAAIIGRKADPAEPGARGPGASP